MFRCKRMLDVSINSSGLKRSESTRGSSRRKSLKSLKNLNGFDDLKKFCHKNNDFLRDVSSLLTERVKLEQLYAENLSKISAKARKICGDVIGSLRITWDTFSTQLDKEASIHKELSTDILEEIAKPLKSFADTQKESRKPAELVVEKAGKYFSEKRTKEGHAKKIAYGKAKESEGLIVQLENSRAKTLAEKELTKLDAKCKKAEEGVEKADHDYINKLIDAERARLALDSAIASSTKTLQKLEEEKVNFMKKLFSNYTSLLLESTPKLKEAYTTLESSVQGLNPEYDMKVLIESRGPTRQPAEQVLFSCYEEDLGNTFEASRRKYALESKLKKIMKALQGEIKAKKGLSKLSNVYNDNPNFSTLESQQDVGSQLQQSSAVIDMLDASVFRLGAALGRLGQYEAPYNRLAEHIEEKRDKLGMLTCVLKVPLEEVGKRGDDNIDDLALTDCTNIYSGLQFDDFDGDEFDDVDAEVVEQVASVPPEYTSIDMCQADYEYIAQEGDELTIKPGDVITVTIRHDDGWWKGELQGRQGLFPASYVHQL